MGIKVFGVIFILVGCGGFGFKLASAHKREEGSLRVLIRMLDYMECELQYRLTPLPSLCRQAAIDGNGTLKKVFCKLANCLEDHINPNVDQCMKEAMRCITDIPPITKSELELLGASLGRFDIDGQLKGLEFVRQDCKRNLNELADNRDVRVRSYQTLGLCAGAALAILLI